MQHEIRRRAARHAALGDPVRLGIVGHLMRSDRSPKELSESFGLAGNLLAHHLDVLERVGLIERFASTGDRRRRYVRLVAEALHDLTAGLTARSQLPDEPLFVCTHNSARSQLAAALWRARTGGAASSAGTHPADAVHPEAVAAARRAGIDLADAVPRHIADVAASGPVITVCDRAHEELEPDRSWWHWSIADPAEIGKPSAFDSTLAEIDDRIRHLSPEITTS